LAELARRSLSPSLKRLEATGPQAVEWGQAIAVTPDDALARLLGPGSYPKPAELHREVFAAAEARERQTSMDNLGGPGNLELLYHLTQGLEAKRVVETGVSYGWSTLAILLAQESIGGGALISTDMPHVRVGNEPYVGAAVPEAMRASWTLIRQPDRSGLPKALSRFDEIDLAHYDSDKTYAGQSWGFDRLWDRLRPGGVLIADDIDYQLAFRDFAAARGVDPIVVEAGKLIGILRKPGGQRSSNG
jgi:predicted O-methyltransferase YrrM